MRPPETQYAERDGSQIAYQVFGRGQKNIVISFGFSSNCDLIWDVSQFAQVLENLGKSFRVILFDRRGTGQSDRLPLNALPTWEDWADDVLTVMNALLIRQAVIHGENDGSMMALLFAAMHPERTEALSLGNATARFLYADDYPIGLQRQASEQLIELLRRKWGTEESVRVFQPEIAESAHDTRMTARVYRGCVTPNLAASLMRHNLNFDVRAVLPTIHVPTIVFHRKGFQAIPVEHGRYIAEHIPNARMVELEGEDAATLLRASDSAQVVSELLTLVTGTPAPAEPERMLATIMFCDIVDSTRHAAEMADRGWHELLERFYALVRSELSQHGGRELDTAGDGIFMAFDRPTRAIHCAMAIRQSVNALDLEVRCGVHCGECVVGGEKPTGMAVHIGARIASIARPSEIWVSETVKALTMGAGINFSERGTHELKGVPDEWALYAVE